MTLQLHYPHLYRALAYLQQRSLGDPQRDLNQRGRARFDWDAIDGLRQWIALRETPFAFARLLHCEGLLFAHTAARFPLFSAPAPLFLPLRHLR